MPPIDRGRIKAKAAEAPPPAERTIRSLDDLVKACRSCRTVAELIAMLPRIDTFDNVRRNKVASRDARIKNNKYNKNIVISISINDMSLASLRRNPDFPGLRSEADQVLLREAKVVNELKAAILRAATTMPADAMLDADFWKT